MHKRAAFLARVSTERQREDATIESQIDEIKRRIAEDGNVLVEECQYIDEGYTGELLARPALDKMRDDAKRRMFDVLYVYDRGRLSRKYAYQEVIIDELADLGIAFVTLHDAKAETPEERILQSMQGVFHEYERMKIVERFRRGKLFKAQSGKLLGYTAPYGYRYILKSEERDGYFEVYESEAAVVRQIFDLAASGMATRAIARWLKEHGIMPPKGHRETWQYGTISDILRNETYVGLHHYNKSETMVAKRHRDPNAYQRLKRTSARRRPKQEWIPIQVPAIVKRDVFDRVARQASLNALFASRNTKREYLLSGLVWCPCGFRRGGGTSDGHSYYRSKGPERSFPEKSSCTCKGVRCDKLDPAVWTAVTAAISDPELIRSHARRWLEGQAKGRAGTGLELDAPERMRNELKKLQEEEKRYALAFGQEVMSFETYQGVMKDLVERKNRLERLFNDRESTSETPLPSLDELVDSTMETLSTLDYSNKRRILIELVKQIVATRTEATVMLEVRLPEKNIELRHRHHYTDGAILPFEVQVGLPQRRASIEQASSPVL